MCENITCLLWYGLAGSYPASILCRKLLSLIASMPKLFMRPVTFIRWNASRDRLMPGVASA